MTSASRKYRGGGCLGRRGRIQAGYGLPRTLSWLNIPMAFYKDYTNSAVSSNADTGSLLASSSVSRSPLFPGRK